MTASAFAHVVQDVTANEYSKAVAAMRWLRTPELLFLLKLLPRIGNGCAIACTRDAGALLHAGAEGGDWKRDMFEGVRALTEIPQFLGEPPLTQAGVAQEVGSYARFLAHGVPAHLPLTLDEIKQLQDRARREALRVRAEERLKEFFETLRTVITTATCDTPATWATFVEEKRAQQRRGPITAAAVASRAPTGLLAHRVGTGPPPV